MNFMNFMIFSNLKTIEYSKTNGYVLISDFAQVLLLVDLLNSSDDSYNRQLMSGMGILNEDQHLLDFNEFNNDIGELYIELNIDKLNLYIFKDECGVYPLFYGVGAYYRKVSTNSFEFHNFNEYLDLIKNDIRDARYAREPMTFVIPFRKR